MAGLLTPITVTGSLTPETALVKNADGSTITNPTFADCVYDAVRGEWLCKAEAPVSATQYPIGAQLFRLKGSNPPIVAYSKNTAFVSGGTTNPGTGGGTTTNQKPTVSLSASTTSVPTVGVPKDYLAGATDADGTVTQVSLVQVQGVPASGADPVVVLVLATDTTSPYILTWTPTTAGTVYLAARATDNQGAVSFSSVLTAQVSAGQAASGLSPATLTWQQKSVTLLNDYEPAAWRQSQYSFASPPPAGELLQYTHPAGATGPLVTYEAEGAGWTRTGNLFPDTGAIYRNGTGLAGNGTGTQLSRMLTGQIFKLYGPTDPTLGVVGLRLTRNGSPIFYQEYNQGQATHSSEALFEFDAGTSAPTFVEPLYLSGTGSIDALDVLTPNSTLGHDPIYASGALVLTGTSATDEVLLLPTGPKVPWNINVADFKEKPTVSVPDINTYVNVIIGCGYDVDNFYGALYIGQTNKLTIYVAQGGKGFAAPIDLQVPVPTWPCRIGAVCTGTLITVLMGPLTGPLVPVVTWDTFSTGFDLSAKSLYQGPTAYRYLYIASVDKNATLSAKITGIKAGHFGSTAVGDCSILTDFDANPIVRNNKLAFGGSLRGFYLPSQQLGNLLNNNANGIMWVDLATVESATPAFSYGSLVYADCGTTLEGEGSPTLELDPATGTWHNLTPQWHLAQDIGGQSYPERVRLAHGATTQDILTPGVYITPSQLVTVDPTRPTAFVYDGWALRKPGTTTIRWAYTEQQATSPYYMGMRISDTTLAFNSFTHFSDNITPGLENRVEGVRGTKVGGALYFAVAGINYVDFFTVDGVYAGRMSQPESVRNSWLGIHPAMVRVLCQDGKYRQLYVAFDAYSARTGLYQADVSLDNPPNYDYGKIQLFISEQLD